MAEITPTYVDFLKYPSVRQILLTGTLLKVGEKIVISLAWAKKSSENSHVFQLVLTTLERHG